MRSRWRILYLGFTLAASTAMAGGSMTATIQEVKARHEAGFMNTPGVVSVGIGLDEEGRHAIIVGLDKERPDTVAALPREIDGHPVRVRVVGTVRAQ